MVETRSKRFVQDYAGLAALVTAVGGLLSMFLSQSNQQDQTEDTQATILALLQYRLSVVEMQCGVATPPQPMMMAPVAESFEDFEDDDWAEEGDDGAEGAGESSSEPAHAPVAAIAEPAPPPDAPPSSEEPQRDLKRKLQAKRNLDLGDIQEYVRKSGKALRLEDF